MAEFEEMTTALMRAKVSLQVRPPLMLLQTSIQIFSTSVSSWMTGKFILYRQKEIFRLGARSVVENTNSPLRSTTNREVVEVAIAEERYSPLDCPTLLVYGVRGPMM